jgi:D-psicose/D-tagatose/L-ribulose 3-epimerase
MGEKARARDNGLKCLREIIKTAETAGVDYCFEVVNRFEQFILNTSEEAVDFAKEVGSPRAKILLDVYHMNIEEDNIAKAILHAAREGRLGHVHVGESNRRIPGTGDTHIDWNAIGNALVEGGYRGAVVMEPFVLAAAHNAKKICVWRDLSGMGANVDLARLVRDAETGGAFLRGIIGKAGGWGR